MNTVLTILCCLAVLFGLFLIVQYLRSKTYAGDAETLGYKDGLPILPRNQRNDAMPIAEPDIVPDEPMQSVEIDLGAENTKSARELAEETKADALSSLAMVASQSPTEPPKYTMPPDTDEYVSDAAAWNKADTRPEYAQEVASYESQDTNHQDLADVPPQAPQQTATDHTSQADYHEDFSHAITHTQEVKYDTADDFDNQEVASEKFFEPVNDFNQNSPMLDRHLIEQQTFDQNNDPLLHAQDTVTIVITPRNQYVGLSGKEVLNIVRNYGLKYGVMNMYHRYEREDGMGDLWFSMMGVDYSGVQVFDLNTLPDAHFTGLSLFLSLPHPHALRGFESMVSTARMIAKDLNADIHDEEGYLLDDNYIEKIRLQVADYTT